MQVYVIFYKYLCLNKGGTWKTFCKVVNTQPSVEYTDALIAEKLFKLKSSGLSNIMSLTGIEVIPTEVESCTM